jgi:hypothetical protein
MPSQEIKPGDRFDCLEVIRRDPQGKTQHAYWICRCDCGREYKARGASLRDGSTTRCQQCASEARVATRNRWSAPDTPTNNLALTVYNVAAKYRLAGVVEMQELMDLAHAELKRNRNV